MALALGVGIGVPFGGLVVSNAVLLLSTAGPYGAVMDYTDASIAIADSTGALNYQSKGDASGGALIGPAAKQTYAAPSPKMLEQKDGFQRYGAHNIYLNNGAPANQSVTVLSGATYKIRVTGTVSIALSGATTGTVTAGSPVSFTASTATLTCGSTSGAGKVYLYCTPCNEDDIDTAGTALYALPYRWSGGVRQGIEVEPQATNTISRSDISGFGLTNAVRTPAATLGPDGLLSGAKVEVSTTVATTVSAPVTAFLGTTATYSLIIKKGSGATEAASFVLRNATTATNLLAVNFNYDTGAIAYTIGVSGASADALPNGWWRLSLTVSSGITSGDNMQVYCGYTGGVYTAGMYMYVYHVQLEAGTVATSPIITYGSAVVRANDQQSILNALFPYNGNTEGTYFAEFTLRSTTGTQNVIAADLNGRGIFHNGTQLATYDGTNLAATGVPTVGVKTRVSASYGPAGILICKDGGSVTTGAYDGTWGGSQNNMQIGWASGSLIGCLSLHKIGYFPVQKTGAALQGIGA